MAYKLWKLVRVSALKQLAEKIKDHYYNKEEVDEKLTNLTWETFGNNPEIPENNPNT